jgi:NADPH:quinone reductase-like Zn-dependent oxidoreductase
MRAIIHSSYGPPDEVLAVEEVDRPEPKHDEVLVRVRAASLHADVWHVVAGVPLLLRLMGNGLGKPKHRIPGTDLAGIVEAVGSAVTRFAVGDEVFGESARFGWMNGGAYAEYAAVREDCLVPKPTNLSFEQAAALPTVGFIAMNNLGPLDKTGQSILINGAGGAMGTLQIQIAKAQGARVTAVDSADKLELMRSLGADRVIDYRQENFLEGNERFDLIVDVVGLLKPKQYRHVLTPKGHYMPIGHADYGRAPGRLGGRIVGSVPYFVWLLLKGLLNSEQRKAFKLRSKTELTAELQLLAAEGKLTPVIGKSFPLEEVTAAMRCMIDGKQLGRIIITPEPEH